MGERHLPRGELNFRSFSSPNISNLHLPMLPPNAYRRVDEWNRTAGHGFAAGNDVTVSGSRERTTDGFSRLNDYGDVYDDDEVTPWDSVSMASLRSTLKNDISTNGGYDFPPGSVPPGSKRFTTSWTAEDVNCRSRNIMDARNGAAPPSNSLHGASGETPNSRLLSCIDSLDYLSKKLESASSLATEVEKFRWASRSQNPAANKSRPQSLLEWKVGSGMMKATPHMGGMRRGSEESWGTDSGINSNAETGYPLTEMKRSSRPGISRKLNRPHNQNPVLRHPSENIFEDSFRNNSMNDHRSNCGSFNQPTNFVKTTTREQMTSFPPDSLYAEVQNGEDLYEYGAFSYAPSSVYDEELYQRNGWFYLSDATASNNIHATERAQPSLKNPLGTGMLASASMVRESNPITNQFDVQKPQIHSYGALSETFLNPTDQMSPFCAALNATCAKDYLYDELPPTVGSNALRVSEGKKPKSVRFSKTVQERTENSDSEVEDSTSIMKGAHDEDNKKSIQMLPNSSITTPYDPSGQEVSHLARNLSLQPSTQFLY